MTQIQAVSVITVVFGERRRRRIPINVLIVPLNVSFIYLHCFHLFAFCKEIEFCLHNDY